MATGIYELKNYITGKRLIIGTTQIKATLKQHLDDLYYGVHDNTSMQDDYETNWTKSPLETNVLIKCIKPDLVKLEQQYLIEHKDDSTIVNDRDENGVPIGYAQTDIIRLRNKSRQIR